MGVVCTSASLRLYARSSAPLKAGDRGGTPQVGAKRRFPCLTLPVRHTCEGSRVVTAVRLPPAPRTRRPNERLGASCATGEARLRALRGRGAPLDLSIGHNPPENRNNGDRGYSRPLRVVF